MIDMELVYLNIVWIVWDYLLKIKKSDDFLGRGGENVKIFLMREKNIGTIDISNGSIDKEIKVIIDNYDDSFLETKSTNFTGVTNKSRRDNCKVQKKNIQVRDNS